MRGMPASERRLWREATTLHDLGDLTARWLAGEITSQPGYQPRCGPDDETRELIPTLAHACRAGYVTHGSQPGTAPEPGYDGAIWAQRATVDGWLASERVAELTNAAHAAGLIVIAQPVYRRRRQARQAGDGIDVTRRAGEVVTVFGRPWTESDVAFTYDECGDDAIDTLCRAQLVTLAAPEYGPETRLWSALDEWAGRQLGDTLPESRKSGFQ